MLKNVDLSKKLSMIKLKKGDKIDTLFYGAKLSQPQNVVEVEVESFTLGEHPVFKDMPLMKDEKKGTAEHFSFMFEMTDLQNNTATSKVVFFTIKDNRISLSDVFVQ